MDFSNHHRIGPHINIPKQSTENSLWVHAYRASRMPTIQESCGTDVADLRSRIHCLEKEAYTAVLRAFNVQSDGLSWAKEELITELRKELNITDQEHRKLLADNNSDESLRMIREWRKGSFYTQELPSGRMDDPGFVSSSVGNASLKISRTSHADVSTLQRYASHSQLTAAANSSRFPIQVQCRDGQRTGELSTFYTRNTQQSTGAVIPNVMTPSASRHRGTVIPLSKKGFHVADVDNLQRKSDIIQIRATDKLLQKVESLIYGRENPNPVQVEKAKSILVEHEGAILEALSKLADVLDGDDSPKQFQYQDFQEELLGIRRGMTTHNSFCAQVDNRLRLH